MSRVLVKCDAVACTSRVVVLLFLVLLLSGAGVYATTSEAEHTIPKIDPSLIDHLRGKVDERFRVDGSSVFVFVRLRQGYSLSSVDDVMISKFAFGPRDSPTMIFGTVRWNSLLELASRRGVLFVSPDVRLQYDRMMPDPDVYREGLAADMYRVRQIIGADRVNDLGILGDGVTIAIVDTGTDFTIPDLREAVARDAAGSSISFDADGQSYVITELVVEREGDVLKTAGKTVDVWNAESFENTDEPAPSVQQIRIDVDYGAPAIQSRSGKYHFGIMRQVIEDDIGGLFVTIDFPIVVVDAQQVNVYDTVVFDISTAFYNFLTRYRSRLNSDPSDFLDLGLSWPQPNPSWNDHSFTDESAHTSKPNNDLIDFDINGDGVADFTAGILASGLDFGGRTGKLFALLPPIDANGNFVNVFFDFQSHGTSTASIAASRGILSRAIYKNSTEINLSGIAPKANIMGVKALWVGDITFAWYYAAGFDWDPVSFVFRYTGKHRADIISNSWGISSFIWSFGTTAGLDAVNQLADALSLPGYLDPAYPGVTIVASAGNEGYGYGTVNSPASATLPIIVGATTSYAYREHPSYRLDNETVGSYDEVVPWSSRGPTSIGEPKPDVVNVGAFGFTDQSTYTGFGDGKKAYTIFGGTSMSCPLTAGTAALVIEEYRKTHDGLSPRPDVVKAVLASGATDLSYDVFTQGSGRVDAFEAVAAAADDKDPKFPKRFYVTSTSTWDTARDFLADTWSLSFHRAIPNTPMVGASWFAGIVLPGTSTETTLVLRNAAGVEAKAFEFKQIGIKRYSGKAASGENWVTLPKSDIPENADLMKVTLVYHFTDFADTRRWDVKGIMFAQLYDENQKGLLRRITNDAKLTTVSELVVSRPLDKFSGTPKAKILNIEGPAGVSFELVVRYYERIKWQWIEQLSVSGDEVNVRLMVPASSQPGVYDGLILLADGEDTAVVPVSVLVPILTSGNYGGTLNESPYDSFAVTGGFDWASTYNTGDWRVFAVVVDRTASELRVKVSWSDLRTAIQPHLVGPSGYLIASSEYPYSLYRGSGKFMWSTSTGGPADEISASEIRPGVYLVVLHNTLLGVSSFGNYPESFVLAVEIG